MVLFVGVQVARQRRQLASSAPAAAPAIPREAAARPSQPGAAGAANIPPAAGPGALAAARLDVATAITQSNEPPPQRDPEAIRAQIASGGNTYLRDMLA